MRGPQRWPESLLSQCPIYKNLIVAKTNNLFDNEHDLFFSQTIKQLTIKLFCCWHSVRCENLHSYH